MLRCDLQAMAPIFKLMFEISAKHEIMMLLSLVKGNGK